jgi:hypothetical protein
LQQAGSQALVDAAKADFLDQQQQVGNAAAIGAEHKVAKGRRAGQ